MKAEVVSYVFKCECAFWHDDLPSLCNELCCVVNVGEDCPVFDGLYEFCQLSTGGSIGIQQRLSVVH